MRAFRLEELGSFSTVGTEVETDSSFEAEALQIYLNEG